MSTVWTTEKECLVAKLSTADLGFTPCTVWNPSPSRDHRTEPYPLPQTLRAGIFGTRESGSKFSPPPFAVVLESAGGERLLVNVVADSGWHRWNWVDFVADSDCLKVVIDLEGQTSPKEASTHVRLELTPAQAGESRHALLARGLRSAYTLAGPRDTGPDWWRRPIYCGWGDQVTTSMLLEGLGPEQRALAYCIQGLYERWIARLDEAGVPFGTTIIDHGWGPAGALTVDPVRWPDLKGFIAREHERGRKVLLWLATWLWDGLPDEWCVFGGGHKLVADPTHPAYLDYLRQQVHDLLSPDGLDADGFKIDQLAYAPCQRKPRGGPRFGWTHSYPEPAEAIKLHGGTGPGQSDWGTELLYRYQKTIYDAAKAAKPDALITSSTVHPLFHDSLDMVRLHDTGPVVGDVIEAMRARSDLAEAALPGVLIDSDDWVHSDYGRWMDYTTRSHALGVPCIFYAEHFMRSWQEEPATNLVPLDDLRTIAQAWKATGI